MKNIIYVEKQGPTISPDYHFCCFKWENASRDPSASAEYFVYMGWRQDKYFFIYGYYTLH